MVARVLITLSPFNMIDFTNKKLKILNITHCDLDGAVAGIVIKNYYDDVITYVTNYNKAPTILTYINMVKTEIDAIVFTDFSPMEFFDELKILDIPFLVLDHHESALPINDPANGIIVNLNFCGAKLAYLYYVRSEPELEKLKELVEITNDYDMWILEDPRSKHFNTLFWIYYGFNSFYERFKDGEIKLKDWEKKELVNSQKKFKKIWDELPLIDLPKGGCLVEVTKSLSDISIELGKLGYEWFAMFNPRIEKLHLRSRTDKINLLPVMDELGRGGGHRKATACLCTNKELQTIINRIVNFL